MNGGALTIGGGCGGAPSELGLGSGLGGSGGAPPGLGLPGALGGTGGGVVSFSHSAYFGIFS